MSKNGTFTEELCGDQIAVKKKVNLKEQRKITNYFSSKDNNVLNSDVHLTNGYHSKSKISVSEENVEVRKEHLLSMCTRSHAQKMKGNSICDKSVSCSVNGNSADGHSPSSKVRPVRSSVSSSSNEDEEKATPGSGPTTPHKIQAHNEAKLRLESALSPKDFNKLNIVSPRKLIFPSDKRPSVKQNGTLVSEKNSTSKAADSSKPHVTNNLKNNLKLPLKNTQMTQYFPIRRSHRKSKTKLLLEKQKEIEEKILSGKEEGLKIEYFDGKGRGIVTKRPFKKGEMVVEYVGKLIEIKEAKEKEKKYALDSSKGCYMYYFTFQNTQYCIDATEESKYMGRLVNHSRNGNLVTKAIEVNGKAHLILMAKKDIPAGVEILYDYGDRSKQSLEHHPWLAL